ncbi:hypothetical protein CTAM01_16509 [Colletotrichum tamarilloi]|uniref:Uncharacterized protein n=1 Tax=Colletotrichum tamarilloi TaxID=1209934 RepID=A0ABQ9QIB8_9PEZI|nr:uncharacterized protein CTAM01_16509 [Colletotrichum tamarilloi]KAK1471618.1 hypothetical protein CTAM01_16509 [Colletotrichum tamarilloi]
MQQTKHHKRQLNSKIPGRLDGRPDPPHLRHAGNEDAEAREARPNAATLRGSFAALSQESGSYLAQLTPQNQRSSTSTTVHGPRFTLRDATDQYLMRGTKVSRLSMKSAVSRISTRLATDVIIGAYAS